MTKMKSLLALAAGLIGFGLAASAQAETVISVTQERYDAVGRPMCTAVRMNPAVYGSLPADACALGTTGSNGPDRITYNQYNNLDQLIEVDQALGVTTANGFPQTQRAYARYSHTVDGLKATEMDANGNKTMYVYDGFDRVSQVQYPSTTAGSGGINTADYDQYGYDANGNKTSWRRRNGKTISYSFDNLNRELTRSVSDGSVQTVYSGYDLQGHMLYARYGSTSGAGVTNYYDALGRLTATTDLNARSISFGYNQASTRLWLVYPDNQWTVNGVDGTNRLTSIGWEASTGLITHAYDNLGHRVWIGRRPDASGNNLAGYTGISYDNLGRVTNLSTDLGGTAYDIGWSFTYNPAGQINSTAASSTVYDYKETSNTTVAKTYDGLNRDQTIAVLSNGYDANGNLTNDGSRLFYYDVYNRLTGVGSSAYPNNGPYLTFVYDPLGRLASQTYYGTTTSFLYDDTNLIAEYDGSGNMTERYIHGDGVDEPLVWFHGSGTSDERFFIQDYHGSVIGYTDASGNLQNLYKYGPYGEPKNINNGNDFTGARFRYTGQTVIPEAGLYYYKARAYDPIMGRFLQTDPIGSGDDLDLYSYTADDPIDGVDPNGTEAMTGSMINGVNTGASCSGNCNGFGAKVVRGAQRFANAIIKSAEKFANGQMAYAQGLQTSAINIGFGKGSGADFDNIAGYYLMSFASAFTDGEVNSSEFSITSNEINLAVKDSGVTIGTIRGALNGDLTGNLGIPGTYSMTEAQRLGESFVGPNYSMLKDGKGLLSSDGLRVYRFPVQKNYGTQGILTGNLESRLKPTGPYTANVHFNVEP
jgi:RHS repeat-associated protein